MPATGTISIGDRDIAVKLITDGQIAVLFREAHNLQKDEIPVMVRAGSLDRIDRVVRSMIVDPDELEYVDDLILTGKLELVALMTQILETLGSETKAPAAPKATRGRPRKRT
jgi:hypothetical protein